MKPAKLIALILLLSLLLSTSSITFVRESMAARQTTLSEWQTGPFPPSGFQYARHDGAFVPGPALEPWANKIYFLGGRTSPGTESPHIWMFDPVSNTYTDTGADVVEDVSNYNANLILDDGTGRGPAVYVIGGTDKDHGGVTIGMVQRYYPKTNEAESLPSNDNFNGRVGGSLVAAVGSAVVNDIIYVYGGWETNVAPYFSTETWAFDPNQPLGARWTNLELNLHTARSYIINAAQDGKIYAIGGVGSYVGGELDPVDTVEVLDTNNLSVGWTMLTPLPLAGGEGRGFGFDSDTLNIDSLIQGKLYVVAPNDWPYVSSLMYEYDIAANTWYTDVPTLTTPVADMAGSYVPICTSDINDGLPGMWTFGGRRNESCDPPQGPTQFYPLACETGCTPLNGVIVNGPVLLAIDEVGVYTATAEPVDASAPASVLWDGGETALEITRTWDAPGWYSVEITATNCEGSAVVTGTLEVNIYNPCNGLEAAEITGPSSLLVGETGSYTVTWTPIDATLPVDILWSNGITETQATYSWLEPGLQTVSVSAENCGGLVQATLDVEIIIPNYPIWMPLINR